MLTRQKKERKKGFLTNLNRSGLIICCICVRELGGRIIIKAILYFKATEYTLFIGDTHQRQYIIATSLKSMHSTSFKHLFGKCLYDVYERDKNGTQTKSSISIKSIYTALSTYSVVFKWCKSEQQLAQT